MNRYNYILACCIFMLLVACGKSGSQKSIKSTSVVTDSTAVIDHIKQLGDLVYDHPETFLKNRDSLLKATYSIKPHTQEEFTSYQLLLLNIGYVLSHDAQILKSIEVYEKALELYYAHPETPIDFLEYYVKPLGSLYTMTGNIQKAIILQQTALKNTTNAPEKKASVYANLAITIKELHRYDSVIAVCHKGLQYTDKYSVTAARHYNEMADSFLALNQIDSATYYNQLALQILTPQKASSGEKQVVVWKANALSMNGQINLYKKNYRQTFQNLSKALQLFEENFPKSHFRVRAKLYELRGDLFSQQGLYGKAKKEFQKSIALLKPKELSVYPDYTVTYSYFGLGNCYEHIGKEDKAIKFYLLAILNDYVVQQFITTKKSSYYNSARNRQMLAAVSQLLFRQFQNTQDSAKKKQYAFQMLWATELSKGRQLMNAISRSQSQKQNQTTAQHILETQKQLRYLYKSLASTSSAEEKENIKTKIKAITYKSSLAQNVFQRQYKRPEFDAFVAKINRLSQKAALISWQINAEGPDYVLSVADGMPQVKQLDKDKSTAALVYHFLKTYFYQGPQAYNNNPKRYFKHASNVLNRILPQFESCAQASWILSPDGFIYGLPIEALTTQNHFLIQEKNIRSAYTLLHYQNNVKEYPKTMRVNLFAKAKHAPPFEDLPYIPKEIDKIEMCVKTKVFKGDATGFKNFQHALNTTNILHISTHAVAEKKRDPYLILDKKISLNKLQFVLTKAPLVVLSACETGKGETIAGEGMESLNKAFLSKGVKGVIAARWQVNDAFTPVFMKEFYALLSEEKNPAKALRDAKLHFINTPKKLAYKNPWLWASLNYTGSPIKINLQKNDTPYYQYILLIGIVIGVLFLLNYRRKKWKLSA